MSIKTGKLTTKEDAYENILEAELATKNYLKRAGIYGSSAGLCERQTAGLLLLSSLEFEKRNGATEFYFGIGNAFHEIVVKALINNNKKSVFMAGRKEYEDYQRIYLLATEKSVNFRYENVNVSFRIDALVNRITNSGESLYEIVEIKTCGKLPDRPKTDHLAQLYTYLVLTGVDHGILWYVSRDVSDFTGKIKQKVFYIKNNPESAFKVAKRVCMGANFAENLILPLKPKHIKKSHCGYCPLKPLCWEDDKSIAIDAEFPSENTDEMLDLTLKSEKQANYIVDHKNEWLELFLSE